MKLYKLPIKYIFIGIKNYILDIISDVKYRDIFAARYKICQSCEKKSGILCSECGCVLKIKTKVEECECPIGKWLAISKLK